MNNYGQHPTTAKVPHYTITINAYLLKPGYQMEQGTVTKVLPMNGFSSMQVRIDTKSRPIVLNKNSAVTVRKPF